MPEAVVFDLDGVLVDSERFWDDARREVACQHDGTWPAGATAAMQGMSSTEWAHYMVTSLGVRLDEARTIELVTARLMARYDDGLPLLPDAQEVVRRLSARWPLGMASSSNRIVMDRVLALSGLSDRFAATVSSEEVAHGKPAPDVYVEVARRLGRSPVTCVAIEDSANGIRAALSAGARVVAVPNRAFPPPAEVLETADAVVARLGDVEAHLIEDLT